MISITMAVNEVVYGMLKYEKVLGNAISNTLCKRGIQPANTIVIRLTESQYTPNANIKNKECSIKDAISRIKSAQYKLQ